MIVASRSLRFLALTLGGWTVLRVALLWPSIDSVSDAVHAIAPVPPALAEIVTPRRDHAPRLTIALPMRQSPRVAATTTIQPVGPRHPFELSPLPQAIAGAGITVALAAPIAPDAPIDLAAAPSPLLARFRPAGMAARLSASGWLIARPGGGTTVPFAGQLGGSQAGMRITYALGDAQRLAVAARFSSALGSRQREAALGLDWQPTRLPVHLFAEQRVGIERARGGPSMGLIAGLPPTPIAGGFRLEGYGQAGGIARGGIEGFVDGSLRLARPVATFGSTRLDLGAGAWGGAQRGAARFDIGPSLALMLPVTGRNLRLSLDWRQRIAGRAAPGSGPALSLGSDF